MLRATNSRAENIFSKPKGPQEGDEKTQRTSGARQTARTGIAPHPSPGGFLNLRNEREGPPANIRVSDFCAISDHCGRFGAELVLKRNEPVENTAFSRVRLSQITHKQIEEQLAAKNAGTCTSLDHKAGSSVVVSGPSTVRGYSNDHPRVHAAHIAHGRLLCAS